MTTILEQADFSYLNFYHQSHWPGIVLKYCRCLKIAFRSSWSLFLKMFFTFPCQALSSIALASWLSLLWIWWVLPSFFSVLFKTGYFLPLTNGEERRRIMFQPCLLSYWFVLVSYWLLCNSTELVIHIQLLTIPPLSFCFICS